MAYQTQLANALRERGVRVEEYSGWTSRGSSSFTPGGAVCHWTAGPCGATGRPSLSTVVNGRSDLAGPLANVYLDRSGIAVVVAAGRANHAGEGGWHGLAGNSSVFGVEAECCNAGDWTSAQRDVYPRVMAALCDAGGFDASLVCGHNEWTPRKIDIHDWPMDAMRASVGQLLNGGDWLEMATQTEVENAVRKVLNEGTAQGQSNWAGTSKATLGTVQGHTNSLNGIRGVVDSTAETVDAIATAVGARVGVLRLPANLVLVVLLLVALVVGVAIGAGVGGS